MNMPSGSSSSQQDSPRRKNTAPAGARDRILDAYTTLLIDGNHRSATLDAVAARAEVSKGGLLYHFPSKDALASGLITRLRELAELDIAGILQSDIGVVEYFIRTSIGNNAPLDRALIATVRLAQDSQEARDALADINQAWYEVVLGAVHDPQLALTIQLISDGIYYNTALNTDISKATSNQELVDAAVSVINRLATSSG